MITLVLDRTSKMPLYEQLYRHIRGDIENGHIRPGEKIPSKRRLAEHLKISTVTVETAYAQLAAEGYLRSMPKSGFFAQPFDSGPLNMKAAAQSKVFPPAADIKPPHYEYDFKTNAVITGLFPFAAWAKLGREVLAESSDELLNITHPQGSMALRSQIADYLYKFRGVNASAEQIVLGAGSEYLTVIILQLLGRQKHYALENPGYGKIRNIFQVNGIQPIAVELDEHGISADELKRTNADVVHVTPSHQFPSGIVMPVGRRLALLKWAGESDVRYILEDDYDSEFRFSGQPIPALQGLDRAGKVIYINAFTKSLAPSLRISYMVLPPRLAELYREKFMFYSCTVPNFEQYTLCKFMQGGYFERHLSRMRCAYKERRDRFINAVSKSALAPVAEIIGADAGLHLLLKISNGMDEAELIARAKTAGVRVNGLTEYYIHPPRQLPRGTLVIGYSALSPSDISAAVERLEKAWI